MHSAEVFPPVDVNRTYGFRYPDFTRPGESYAVRMRFEWIQQWHGDWLITGTDLETGEQRSYYYGNMIDVEALVRPMLPASRKRKAVIDA